MPVIAALCAIGKKMDIESALNELKSAGLIARFDEKNVHIWGGLKEQKSAESISVIIKNFGIYKTKNGWIAGTPGQGQIDNSQHFDELEAAVNYVKKYYIELSN